MSYPVLTSATLRWLGAAIVAVAVPSIACFGFYTLEAAGEAGKHYPTLVILSYPATLIGLVWLVAAALSERRTVSRLLIPLACFLIPAVFLLLIRS